MAVLRLVASDYYIQNNTTNIVAENISNAYTNIDSDTYATISNIGTQYTYSFGIKGFNFNLIPSEAIIDSVSYKIKTDLDNLSLITIWAPYIKSAPTDGTTFSESPSSTQVHDGVFEFVLLSSVTFDTVRNCGTDLCFIGNIPKGKSFKLYGAEIEVTYHLNRNKIIYGNETLIDLTSDTATASDVLSGKTFHLASGVQATGTLSPSVATATTSSSTARTVSFTVSKEPSWFMMIFASNTSTERSYRVYHMRYDGTTTRTYFGNGSTAGSLTTSDSFGSFSYSSGTLTITVKTAPYFGSAGWALYYL